MALEPADNPRDWKAEAPPPAPSPIPAEKNPVRRVALWVFILAVFLFALSVFMERRTPISSEATVQAYIVGIAPEVAGKVVDVQVTDNSLVTAGQVMFQIDPQEYTIAVDEAESRLALAGQAVGASTAAVDTAQARVVEARATRDNALVNANRAKELVDRGVYAQIKFDDADTLYREAESSLVAAEAELRGAQEDLGPAGSDNPQIKEALAALDRVRLDLIRTTIKAPADGVVTNLQLSVGQMAAVGQSAVTFIDTGTVWITAAYKENSLEKVAAGNRAEVLFDVLPGQLFKARVESVGLGVAQGSVDPQTGLPKVTTESGWVREPQSFPVRLILDEGRPRGVRYGSQASVVIYTGDHPVTNFVGSLWLRLLSVLTYVS